MWLYHVDILKLQLTGHSPPITYSTTTSEGGAQKGEVRTWLDGFSSPLIQDEGDNKLLKLRFDVSQYQPEEIVVKTVDNKLLVRAFLHTVGVNVQKTVHSSEVLA
jgi:hypothetical protein